MQDNGVTGMVDVGCDRASSLLAVRMAERYGWCWAAVGTHPDSAPEVTDALLEEYRALSITIGSEIVASGGSDVRGTAIDINENGELLVRDAAGEVHVLRTGDVSVRGVMGYV